MSKSYMFIAQLQAIHQHAQYKHPTLALIVSDPKRSLHQTSLPPAEESNLSIVAARAKWGITGQ
jgi:hypothetical protein